MLYHILDTNWAIRDLPSDIQIRKKSQNASGRQEDTFHAVSLTNTQQRHVENRSRLGNSQLLRFARALVWNSRCQWYHGVSMSSISFAIRFLRHLLITLKNICGPLYLLLHKPWYFIKKYQIKFPRSHIAHLTLHQRPSLLICLCGNFTIKP